MMCRQDLVCLNAIMVMMMQMMSHAIPSMVIIDAMMTKTYETLQHCLCVQYTAVQQAADGHTWTCNVMLAQAWSPSCVSALMKHRMATKLEKALPSSATR